MVCKRGDEFGNLITRGRVLRGNLLSSTPTRLESRFYQPEFARHTIVFRLFVLTLKYANLDAIAWCQEPADLPASKQTEFIPGVLSIFLHDLSLGSHQRDTLYSKSQYDPFYLATHLPSGLADGDFLSGPCLAIGASFGLIPNDVDSHSFT